MAPPSTAPPSIAPPSSAPAPPPPPPPPPPASTSPVLCQNQSEVTGAAEKIGKSSAGDPLDMVIRRWAFLSQEYPVAVVKYFDVDPIIQHGPQCGLVALVMVARALGNAVTVEEALEVAREKGFTSHGEIFDVYYMMRLSMKVVGRFSTVLVFPGTFQMIHDLIMGKVYLVPYDADSNHEPCKRNGRSAHWAVITGVLIMQHECTCVEALQKLSTEKPIYQAEPDYFCDVDGCVFLFARHGKSRHVAIWRYEDLRESCLQLNEAEAKYDGMIFSEGGIQQGLKGKVLRVEL